MTRIRPAWLTALAYSWAALFIGPLLLTPFGAPVANPTLQAHVRGTSFSCLPLERSLVETLAGYRSYGQSDFSFFGREDVVQLRGEELWIRGASRVEMRLRSRQPLESLVFRVRSLAPGNEVEICVERHCESVSYGDTPPEGTVRQLVLASGSAGSKVAGKTGVYDYNLEITSSFGEQPRWRGSAADRFYLGAALLFLGSTEQIESDFARVLWAEVTAPESVETRSAFKIDVEIYNISLITWPAEGATRVALSYHWLDADGETVIWEGQRTPLSSNFGPGRLRRLDQTIEAPSQPGSYTLELDLIREKVKWFSAARKKNAYRLPIQVTAAVQ